MLGAGLQFNRSRNGEDRFYSAARARRSRNHAQSQDHLRRAQSDVTVSQSPRLPEVEGRAGAPEAGDEKPVDIPLCSKTLEPSLQETCNLGRFLESVTPFVTAQYLSKTTVKGWRTCDVEFRPYFVLGDLWDSFKEWSAYGAGVPLVLDDHDDVVQYYVPYLSGIQLYGDPSGSLVKSRQPAEDSDGDYFRDSCSDGSSDCDERGYLSSSQRGRNYSALNVENALKMDQLSLRDNQLLQEGFSSDESEPGSSQGCLLFEYFERDQPYGRQPLADMISQLSRAFPELKTLRSCDLLPSSWVSVAWYPIYRIPVGPTLKDLDACFLTFHSLHTSVTGSQSVPAPVLKYPSEADGVPKISVPIFGLGHYKFRPSLWIPGGGSEKQLLNSLLKEAENWLTTLRVNHPDFLFFHRR
ncbi:OLC1v1032228C2 [Oldenlandia corymbosa var. corymbosa]|uniref:OLC1v1032228C2 n=1 Tax=Oldenlandia corymbosa var. corymbosa TaxID=529605 RepID=A0AAV1CKQ5_OLDCO|nr:OLC1v1032228C2 [Oldenlandia corymbosa var. corymbosa]